MALVGADFQFTFPTVPGFKFVVQFKDELNERGMAAVADDVGDGLLKTVIVPATSPPERYFPVAGGERRYVTTRSSRRHLAANPCIS